MYLLNRNALCRGIQNLLSNSAPDQSVANDLEEKPIECVEIYANPSYLEYVFPNLIALLCFTMSLINFSKML